MDWSILLTSIGGSAAVAAILVWGAKTAIERTLDVRLKRAEAEQQANIQELFRRQAFVWDRQFETSRILLGLIYRVRNAARDIAAQASASDATSKVSDKTIRELVQRLTTYTGSVQSILFDERAIVPQVIFKLAHDTKISVAHISNLM